MPGQEMVPTADHDASTQCDNHCANQLHWILYTFVMRLHIQAMSNTIVTEILKYI